MPLEKHIVDSIVKYLRTVPGCSVRKRHGTAFGVAGDPDLYGTLNGRHFELEVKQHGNPPTPLQDKRLEEWRAAGAVVGVVHSLSEAREALGC
ncbi:MAG: VRR-NUC domain-containing protein [Acidobacteria bacterium]|nr:VRR-NUC domain-containing protein [Acidobacteriota bacterium]